MANWPKFPEFPKIWDDEPRQYIEEIRIQEQRYIQKMKQMELYMEQHARAPIMTPEARIKGKVKQVLENVNAYYIMPSTGGYGSSGAPDFVVCLRGRFIGIECKAGKNKISLLQDKNLREITNHGGVSLVVDESTNMTELQLKLIYLMEND